MKILIDNGHGVDTSGKRSPDGTLKEYAYTREIAKRVVEALNREGYDAERIVTEENDISLRERCARVNTICSRLRWSMADSSGLLCTRFYERIK